MEITTNKNQITLINESGNKMVIQFAGADLYWTKLDYCDNEEFIISSSDEPLFFYLENIFNRIEEYDISYPKLLNNNTFEWISEAYGIPEESNKLTITKETDRYVIKFFQNPNNIFNVKNLCSVCFCLSGSRNPSIASMFSIMLHECLQAQRQQVKILKPEKPCCNNE